MGKLQSLLQLGGVFGDFARHSTRCGQRVPGALVAIGRGQEQARAPQTGHYARVRTGVRG